MKKYFCPERSHKTYFHSKVPENQLGKKFLKKIYFDYKVPEKIYFDL
jgi:hypothetical protein